MTYTTNRLHFECTQCGECCRGDEDHYIAMRTTELDDLAEYLGISLAWLKRRYVSHFSRNWYSVRIGDDGRCVFLNADNSCRIYPLRPTQCRTYPWWPELLSSKKAWDAEAGRCEGINHGKQVPVSRIMASLHQQIAFEEDTE